VFAVAAGVAHYASWTAHSRALSSQVASKLGVIETVKPSGVTTICVVSAGVLSLATLVASLRAAGKASALSARQPTEHDALSLAFPVAFGMAAFMFAAFNLARITLEYLDAGLTPARQGVLLQSMTNSLGIGALLLTIIARALYTRNWSAATRTKLVA
jgi:hypothetical protein